MSGAISMFDAATTAMKANPMFTPVAAATGRDEKLAATRASVDSEAPFTTILPAINEEFKGVDMRSVGSVVVTGLSKKASR